MAKVFITPRSFASFSKEPLEILKQAGIEVVLNPTGSILNEDEMKEYVKDIDGIIVGVDPLNEAVLSNANKLVSIAKYGVGVDNIDLKVAKQRAMDVTITQGANANAVADYSFTLLLAVARRLAEIDEGCKRGDWSKKVGLDIWGKKIGIIGLGAIGRGMVQRARGFQMEVYANDIHEDKAFNEEHNIHFCDLDTIYKECDFISIHLPLSKDTKHMIDKNALLKMQEHAIIINTARGSIIKEDDLYDALKNQTIYGAGLDVFEHEPATKSKLLTLNNVIVGSHCAASSQGAVDEMSRMAALNTVATLRKRGQI